MIALLVYSMSCLGQTNSTSSTGVQDSTKISYDDLREVNAKLIELKYCKEVRVVQDSIIAVQDSEIVYLKQNNVGLSQTNKHLKSERNLLLGSTSLLLIILLIVII